MVPVLNTFVFGFAFDFDNAVQSARTVRFVYERSFPGRDETNIPFRHQCEPERLRAAYLSGARGKLIHVERDAPFVVLGEL